MFAAARFASSAGPPHSTGGDGGGDLILTAAYAVLGRWREEYDVLDERRAWRVLAEWRLEDLAERAFRTRRTVSRNASRSLAQ